MSGPDEPVDGDHGGDGEEELPQPQPQPQPQPETAAAAAAAEEAAEPVDGDSAEEDTDPDTRAARRAARAAAVRRRRRILLGVGAAFVVLFLAFVLWYELESHAFGPPGPQVVITVHQGESTDDVVNALSQHGVIGSALAFQISEIVHGTPTILPGSYAMHQNISFSDVRQILAAGPNIYPVDVHPGFTLSEVAKEVDSLPGHANESFEKVAASGAVHSSIAATDPNNLEGMLGVGEYLVLPGESDTTILTEMVQRFDHEVEAAGITTASAGALGVTPYQMLTVASIVEKEGYVPVNMPDTARVIYNRLAQGTPLQMDSTVLYALGQDGGPVTSQDLKIQSPYNSYLNTGLTPTPICMPSADALNAAVHPPAGGWLYFVLVKKDGTMAFSDTYAQQLANEQLAKSRGLP